MQLHDPPPPEGVAGGGKTGNKPLLPLHNAGQVKGGSTLGRAFLFIFRSWKSNNMHKALPRPASRMYRHYAQNILSAETHVNVAKNLVFATKTLYNYVRRDLLCRYYADLDEGRKTRTPTRYDASGDGNDPARLLLVMSGIHGGESMINRTAGQPTFSLMIMWIAWSGKKQRGSGGA